jgi:recombination protein RecT
MTDKAQDPGQAPATQAPPAPPTTNDKALERFRPIEDRCIAMFGSKERFMQEASFLLAAVNNTPALQECTPQSIVGVLVSVASSGLSLNPVKKEVYLIPRNIKVKTPGQADRWEKRAMPEPSYMGLMKVATDTGAVRSFEVHEVYQGDELEFDIVNKRPTKHVPYWNRGKERGAIIGVYGMATLADGSIIPEHMGADELKKIRSKSDNASGSVYNDWEGEMARKSLLKRLQKYIPRTPKSEAFLQAVELDNEGFDLATPTGIAAGSEDRVKQTEIMAEVRALIDAYQGEDKDAMHKEVVEEAKKGRVNLKFWEDVRTRLWS